MLFSRKPNPKNFATKGAYYKARLMHERPKTTKAGTPVTIEGNGSYVITRTGRDRYKRGHSVYIPLDYPDLFGWERPGPRR